MHGGRLKEADRLLIAKYLIKVADDNRKNAALQKYISWMLYYLNRMTNHSTLQDVLKKPIINERVCYDKMMTSKYTLIKSEREAVQKFLMRMKQEYKHMPKAIEKADYILSLMQGMTDFDTIEDMKSYRQMLARIKKSA